LLLSSKNSRDHLLILFLLGIIFLELDNQDPILLGDALLLHLVDLAESLHERGADAREFEALTSLVILAHFRYMLHALLEHQFHSLVEVVSESLK